MAADWKVVSQRQQTQLTGQGTFRDVMVVTFEVIPSGTTGNISIPLNQYTSEFVESAINQRVADIKAIESL